MQKLGKFAIASGLLAGAATAVYLMIRNRERHVRVSKPVEPGNAVSTDMVEVASMDSFPASDAPSWIGAAIR